MLLKDLEKNLPQLIRTGKWNSYFIDWVFPMEARIWIQINNARISLQKFYPCSRNQVYFHNHPWRKQMKLVKGVLEQGISTSYDAKDYIKTYDVDKQPPTINKNQFALMKMVPGSDFTIDSPNCWHYIMPLNNEPIYTLMITNEPWFKGPKAPVKKIKKVSKTEQEDIFKNILACL